MNKLVPYLLFTTFVFLSLRAQAQTQQDSVVQFYGVVMSADSLRGLDATSIIVEGTGRGTITNSQGVFSIAALKGNKIRFSSIGFKDKTVTIPDTLKSNQYYVIQLMVNDTAYLPATILKPRPTRAQFERDFVNTDVPADALEIARRNNDEATRKALMMTLPIDGAEAMNTQIRQQAQRYYYSGQLPPQNIFNPVAWAEFIKAWKRGDFKRNK
ncbi:carboxypeptidase-like regulatory domain-containing protein [Parafilimonas sp.]|uniref:carboxypeptidase-like regulatory domain-containing protein n=1 Tax=Parafilimonas sp. TaxID=1969739 RepID=UPI0039E50743